MRWGFDLWVGKIPWRHTQQPTPVFLPGESHGQRSLVAYSPRGRTESDTQLSTRSTHGGFLPSMAPSHLNYVPLSHSARLPGTGSYKYDVTCLGKRREDPYVPFLLLICLLTGSLNLYLFIYNFLAWIVYFWLHLQGHSTYSQEGTPSLHSDLVPVKTLIKDNPRKAVDRMPWAFPLVSWASCCSLDVMTGILGLHSRLTQESGILSRGNKGLLSLLESRRVFLGAHWVD